MSDTVEDLVRVYVGSVPRDVVATALGEDIAYTLAEMFAMAYAEIETLIAGAVLSTATGLFLDLHARDRGLRRQDGETDDQLRERLRRPPQAGTVAAILDAVNAIVDGLAFMIELPRQAIFHDCQTFHDRLFFHGGGRGVVIVLIPASANALASVQDAVRSKISAGKLFMVFEYTT
jgi:hypothetical protein